MVGNGVTDDEFDGNALVPFAHGMGLISDDLYKVYMNIIFKYFRTADFESILLQKLFPSY